MNTKLTIQFCLLTVAHALIGGRNSDRYEVPNMVALEALRADNTYIVFGGGVLIAPFWILTAGRCVYEIIAIWTVDRTLIRLGKRDIDNYEPYQQTVNIRDAFVHDDFFTKNIDGGLILSNTFIEVNPVIQIYPLSIYDEIPTGSAYVAGWGWMYDSWKNQISPSQILQVLKVELISPQDCVNIIQALYADAKNEQNIVAYTINNATICSGPLTGGISACIGDSGGPLLQFNNLRQLEVIGIISDTSDPCGCVGCPTTYVKIPSLINWINKIISLYILK